MMSDGLIGGIGLTHLEVYSQRPGPDGVLAGCAHIHALCDEAYLGVNGSGAIELHDPVNGFRTVPIEPGTYVQFPPGTLHRSVCFEDFEVVALMGNSGLPERGDARIYFGPEVDADPEEFERLKGLAAEGLEGALARRDASAEAYMRLYDLWEADREGYLAELRRFYDCHKASLVERRAELERVVRDGPLTWAEESLTRIGALPADGNGGAIQHAEAGSEGIKLGMCGLLRQVSDLSVLGFDGD